MWDIEQCFMNAIVPLSYLLVLVGRDKDKDVIDSI